MILTWHIWAKYLMGSKNDENQPKFKTPNHKIEQWLNVQRGIWIHPIDNTKMQNEIKE